jgi:hypothetical protein
MMARRNKKNVYRNQALNILTAKLSVEAGGATKMMSSSVKQYNSYCYTHI